eukprot:TRINITY_DN6796_c0_g2_i1.p1 TRINITY_DN6796_c0_g2~~TRINITY_DN6796_c0_g2_i1.p1  ORF type:complete len:719 (-),score=122.58 TRINITY_DN6796_c0_g2_i1:70-2187(-)
MAFLRKFFSVIDLASSSDNEEPGQSRREATSATSDSRGSVYRGPDFAERPDADIRDIADAGSAVARGRSPLEGSPVAGASDARTPVARDPSDCGPVESAAKRPRIGDIGKECSAFSSIPASGSAAAAAGSAALDPARAASAAARAAADPAPARGGPAESAPAPLFLNALAEVGGDVASPRLRWPAELRLQDVFERHPSGSPAEAGAANRAGGGAPSCLEEVVLVNFMIDLSWLFDECPSLERVPLLAVLHGDGGQGCAEVLQRRDRRGLTTRLHAPPLPLQWGTHHSKLALLLYNDCIRVCVRTFNDIFHDFHRKSQAMYVQDFPAVDSMSTSHSSSDGFGSDFERQLVRYFSRCGGFDAGRLRKYDFSSAAVSLVASVPGYHTGSEMYEWGHMRLRRLLASHASLPPSWTSSATDGAEEGIICQCSSFGSFSRKWLDELQATLASTSTPRALGAATRPAMWLVAPTLSQVRDSVEGWVAGVSLHIRAASRGGWLAPLWRRWGPAGTNRRSHAALRAEAMPHVKSYCRYVARPQGPAALAWLFVGSQNMSKSAWGELQKGGSQLCIRSFEVGVLLLPSRLRQLEVDPMRPGGYFLCSRNNAMSSSSSAGAAVFVPSDQVQSMGWPAAETAELPVVCPTAVPPAAPPRSDDPIWAKDLSPDGYVGLDRFGARRGEREASFYGHRAATAEAAQNREFTARPRESQLK